jgi:hypothetical protein
MMLLLMATLPILEGFGSHRHGQEIRDCLDEPSGASGKIGRLIGLRAKDLRNRICTAMVIRIKMTMKIPNTSDTVLRASKKNSPAKQICSMYSPTTKNSQSFTDGNMLAHLQRFETTKGNWKSFSAHNQ